MTELECKIEGCDYRGKPTSLRSHVSGTADEAHSYEDGTKQWKSYDLASEQEKMEQRDREAAEDIEIDDPEDTEDKP